ncbi:MAG: hypothetical protein ACJAWV_000604 [Flammeovirgaceae bacterium]|jgi:hypothetical protein
MSPQAGMTWGFFAHKRINRLAVFTLPPDMFRFYKTHIRYITEQATSPDARRYVVEGEAPKHYIDIDIYGDSAIQTMPRRWKDAVEKYSEDTLMAYGIAPWNVSLMKYKLTEAFKKKDARNILRLSAEIGHYIGDSNVPLHTTENYNGQMTGQYGIHGFWESRLPEAFSEDYDYFIGLATYEQKPLQRAWSAVENAHAALDSVLRIEKELTKKIGEDKKYSYETRNGRNIKVYSMKFSEAYHNELDGQVERQMRASIKMVGDFWFTCWVDAGQPNLDDLLKNGPTEEELEKEMKEIEALKNTKKVKSRDHDH